MEKQPGAGGGDLAADSLRYQDDARDSSDSSGKGHSTGTLAQRANRMS
jgi:hypothetical protein